MRVSQSLTKVVSDYETKMNKAQTDEEYSRLTNGLRREADDLWSAIQKRDRVTEDGVPTHDQMVSEFEDGFSKLQKKYADLVQFRSNRPVFGQAADSLFTRYRGTVKAEADRRKVDYLKGQHTQTMMDLITDPEGLKKGMAQQQSALASGLISHQEQVKEWDRFQHAHHTDRVMGAFQVEREAGRGQAYLDGLKLPKSFDEGETQRIKDQMQADLNQDRVKADRLQREKERKAQAIQTRLWGEGRKYMDMLQSGRTMTDDQYQAAAEIQGQLTDESQAEAMGIALDVYNGVQQVMGMTRAEREKALMATYSPATDYRTAKVQNAVRTAVGAIERTIGQDPHQAWVMYGGGKPMDTITEGNLTESLAALQNRQAQVAAWLGVDRVAPMGLAQLRDLQRIGVSGIDEILTAYGREGAKPVLAMLYKDKAVEMAAVGAIALQPDGEQAFGAYVAGTKVLQANPDYLPPDGLKANDDTAQSVFYEHIAGVFPGDTEFDTALRGIADVVYAGMAADKNLVPGTFDVDLYREAIRMAVGNVETYNDTRLLMPGRGWDLDRFERAIERLTDAQLDTMGGFADNTKQGHGSTLTVTPEVMAERIRDGKITLEQGSEIGTYLVFAGGRPVQNKAGGQFVLDLREF